MLCVVSGADEMGGAANTVESSLALLMVSILFAVYQLFA